MAKRVNKNLVAGLTAVAMIAMMGTSVALIYQLKTTDPAIFVEQAEEAKEQQDWIKAVKLYQQAYTVSQDPIYLVDAGRMFMELERAEDAVARWRKALEIDNQCEPALNEIIELTLDLYAHTNRANAWMQVKEDADRLLTINENSALGHFARGIALVKLQTQDASNADEGVTELRKATELAPTEARFAAALGNQLSRAEDADLDEIENVYKKLVEADESNSEALRYYARFLQRQDRDDEALALLSKAVELDPDDPENHVALGGFHLTKKELDAAKSEFEKAVRIAPESYVGYEALGRLYRSGSPPDPDAAIQVYQERLKRPTQFQGRLGQKNRIACFILLNDAAEATYEKVELVNKDDSLSDEQMREQRKALFDQAKNFIDRAVSTIGRETSQTHILRGRLMAYLNRRREAINEFEAADRATGRPTFEVKYRLATLYYADGEDGAAYSAIQEAIRLRKNFGPSWVLLARLEFARGNYEQAIKWADTALELMPDSKDVTLVKADCYRKQGKIKEAQALVESVTPESGEESVEDLLRLEIIARRQDPPDYAEAERLLNRALELSPGNTKVIERMFTLYRTTGEDEKLKTFTSEMAAAYPDNTQIQALKVYATETDQAKIDENLLEIINKEEDPLARELGLVNFYQRREKYEDALEHLKEASKIRPDEKAIIRGLFNLNLRLKRYDEAEKYASRAAALNLDGADGDFLFGQLFLSQELYDKAIEKLRSALGKHPNDSQANVQLGFAFQQSGRMQEALKAYETAAELNPNNDRAHLVLAKLADEMGNLPLSAQHLAECERLNVDDPWVERKIQQRLEETNPSQGIARREEMLKDDPEDTENLIRLAELHLKVAIDLARAGDNSSSNEHVRQSDAYVQKALDLKPDDPRVVYSVAKLWRRSGRDTEIERAEALLKKLIDDTEDPEAKARAQYLLAAHYRELLPQRPTRETLDLADEAFEASANMYPNRDIAAEVGGWFRESCAALGSDAKKERLAKAVQWYDKALELNKDNAQDELIRRERIEAIFESGDTQGAKAAVADYRKRYPNEAKGLLYQAESDLKTGDLDSALEALTLYIERVPTDPAGYYRRGTIYFQKAQWNFAIDDLTQAKTLAPSAYDFAHRIRLSRCLEMAGMPERGVTELRSILTEFPPERLKKNPRVQDAVNNVAIKLYGMLGRLNRWGEQEALTIKYMDLFDKDAGWAMRRGLNGENQNDLTKALVGFTEAAKRAGIKNNALSIEATDKLLKTLNDLGQHSKVVEIIQSLKPDQIQVPMLVRLAHAQIAMGNKPAAIKTYNQAISMSSRKFDAFRAVAIDMKDKLGAEECIAATRGQLKQRPDDELLKFLLATYLITADPKSAEAQSIYKSLYENAKTDEVRQFVLGPLSAVTYSRKELDDAKTLFEAQIRLEPDDPGALNNLAYLLAEDLNRPKEALPYAEKAADLLPSNPQILDTLGWILVLTGKCQLGVAKLSEAVVTDPALLPAQYHLGKAYICEEKFVDAERHLREAKTLAEKEKDDEFVKLVGEAMSQIGVR